MPGLLAVFSDRQFQNISFCHFSVTFSTNLIMPILPVYLSGKGFAETQIGLIMGTAAVAAVLVRPWVGIQVDTRGSRPILIWGQILLFISICGLLWANGLISLVALRFVYGIAIAFYGTGAVTFASSIGTGATNASAIALYTLMTMLGLGTSMSFSQIFFDSFGFAMIVCTSTIMIGSAYCVMQFRAQPLSIGKSADSSASFMTVLGNRFVLATSAGLFGSNFAFGALFTYIPLAAIASNIHFYSFFFIAFAVAVVGSRFFVQKIIEYIGLQNTCLYGYLAMVLGVMSLVFTMSPASLLATGLLYGVGLGVTFPAFVLLLVERTDAVNRGTSLSILIAAADIAMALSVSILGATAEHFGYPYVFLTVTVILAVCMYVLYALIFSGKSDSSKARATLPS